MLDYETKVRWKERMDLTPFPSIGEVLKFLHDRCNVLEPIGSTFQIPSVSCVLRVHYAELIFRHSEPEYPRTIGAVITPNQGAR
jgi:hypothetical protein